MLISASLSLYSSAASSLEQEKDSLESQLEALKKEQASIAAQIQAAKNQINNQKEMIGLLYDEMDAYMKEAETVSALIGEYTLLAQAKEAEIDALNAEMAICSALSLGKP